MENMLDALLGRTFKASKFLDVVSLATTRIALKKDQHQAECSQVRSAIVMLLKHGYYNGALIRVERIINELIMLDALNMIEGYLNLLIERVNLIEKERVCPNVLKESFATLFYTAYEIRDFPKLQDICCILIAHFGRESCAVELCLNYRVNLKMIIQLSARQPILKCKMKVLKDIASENNIVLQLEEVCSISPEKNLDVNNPSDSWPILREKITKDGQFFYLMKQNEIRVGEVKIKPNPSSNDLNQKQSLPSNQKHCIRILVDEEMHNEN
jgi:hypothetical protein